MKNQIIRNVAMMGLFFMLAIAGVQAQTASRAEVKIPFDFYAGKATLKAGTYSIKRMSGNVLAIRSADGKTTALVNAPLTIGSRESKAGERLVFNAYGEQYFLSQVWLSADTGRQVFTSATEAKLAREEKLAKTKREPKRVEVAIK
jgi:hypothetical protein